MNKNWWISCNKFTITVMTDSNDKIFFTAPIARKFQGQHLNSLLKWAEKFGELKYKRNDNIDKETSR